MKIKLYGLPTCFRCRMAKKMLESRNLEYEYIMATEHTDELPILSIDGIEYSAKEALLKIRSL